MGLFKNIRHRAICSWLLAITLGWAPIGASSKEADKKLVVTSPLKALFDESWQRQPEARSYSIRLESFQARERVTQSFLPKPLTMELAGKAERSSTSTNFGAGGTVAAGTTNPPRPRRAPDRPGPGQQRAHPQPGPRDQKPAGGHSGGGAAAANGAGVARVDRVHAGDHQGSGPAADADGPHADAAPRAAARAARHARGARAWPSSTATP